MISSPGFSYEQLLLVRARVQDSSLVNIFKSQKFPSCWKSRCNRHSIPLPVMCIYHDICDTYERITSLYRREIKCSRIGRIDKIINAKKEIKRISLYMIYLSIVIIEW